MNSKKFGLLVIFCFLVIDQSQCVPNCISNEDCRPCGRGKNTEGTWLMRISLLQSFRTFQKHFGLCDFLTNSFTTANFLGNSLINGICLGNYFTTAIAVLSRQGIWYRSEPSEVPFLKAYYVCDFPWTAGVWVWFSITTSGLSADMSEWFLSTSGEATGA